MSEFWELAELAKSAATHLMGLRLDEQIGSNLVWAVKHVTAAASVSHLVSRASPGDLDQEAFRLLDIPHPDVFETMVVGLAARSAISALDLCASTAWRFKPSHSGEREKTFSYVAHGNRRAKLDPMHLAWAADIASSEDWEVARECRNRLVHRTTPRTFIHHAGSMPSKDWTRYEVRTDPELRLSTPDLVDLMAQSAGRWFRSFCAIRPLV